MVLIILIKWSFQGFIVGYVVYVLIVVLGRVINQKMKKLSGFFSIFCLFYISFSIKTKYYCFFLAEILNLYLLNRKPLKYARFIKIQS